MEQQELPLPPPGDGDEVPNPKNKAEAAGEEGGVNPQTEPQAGENEKPPLSEEDQASILLAKRVQTRLRNLKKRQSDLAILEEKSKSPSKVLLPEQKVKLLTKPSIDALVGELEKLVGPTVPAAKLEVKDASKQPDVPSTPSRRQIQKMKRQVQLEVKDASKQPDVRSYSDIVLKAAEDKAVGNFEAFCTKFTLEGECKSYCTGLAKSIIARHAKTMVLEYKHLEAHNKEMAMLICKLPTKMIPRLTHSARNFVYEIWKGDSKGVSEEVIDGIKVMMAKFELRIAELPHSHKMLEDYMEQHSKVERSVLDTIQFDSPTPCSNKMVSGILSEVIGNHRKGFAWNGKLTIADMEVKDDSQFIITKQPGHSFDPVSKISEEIAGWLKADLEAVWFSVCSKVEAAGHNRLPHYPALWKKLTNTPTKVFLNPVKLHALQETMIHAPASKPELERALLLSGIQTCCRAHDMKDPAAPYKTLLFTKLMPGAHWADNIIASNNRVLNGVLEFNQDDENKPEPEDGQTQFYVGPDNKNFATLKEYMTYIQTHDLDRNGDMFGAFVEYSRHLYNHGSKYCLEKKVFEPLPLDHTGVQYFAPVVQGPRHQSVTNLGIFESASALYVEDALTDMITMLIENNGMVGMLEPYWVRFKSCGKEMVCKCATGE